MTGTIIGLAVTIVIMLVILFLAFLGDRTAYGLEKLTQKMRKGRTALDEGKNDINDSRESTVPKKSSQ